MAIVLGFGATLIYGGQLTLDGQIKWECILYWYLTQRLLCGTDPFGGDL